MNRNNDNSDSHANKYVAAVGVDSVIRCADTPQDSVNTGMPVNVNEILPIPPDAFTPAAVPDFDGEFGDGCFCFLFDL